MACDIFSVKQHHDPNLKAVDSKKKITKKVKRPCCSTDDENLLNDEKLEEQPLLTYAGKTKSPGWINTKFLVLFLDLQ